MLGLKTLMTKPLNFNMLLCSLEELFISQPPPPASPQPRVLCGHVVVVRNSLMEFRFAEYRRGGEGWKRGMINGHNSAESYSKNKHKAPFE